MVGDGTADSNCLDLNLDILGKPNNREASPSRILSSFEVGAIHFIDSIEIVHVGQKDGTLYNVAQR